jgi:hypothetical protein
MWQNQDVLDPGLPGCTRSRVTRMYSMWQNQDVSDPGLPGCGLPGCDKPGCGLPGCHRRVPPIPALRQTGMLDDPLGASGPEPGPEQGRALRLWLPGPSPVLDVAWKASKARRSTGGPAACLSTEAPHFAIQTTHKAQVHCHECPED